MMKDEESDTLYHTMYLDILAWVTVVCTFCAVAMQLATGIPLTTLFTLHMENDYLEGDILPVAPPDARVRCRG